MHFILAALLLWPFVSVAQARAAFTVAVFGDSQRTPDVLSDCTVDNVCTFSDTSLRTSRYIGSVTDIQNDATIGLVLHVGDIVEQGNAFPASACEDIEWRRMKNILIGPRTTFQGAVDCSACTCGDQDPGAPVLRVTDSLTGLNDSSLALASTTKPLIAVRGNHDSMTGGQWNYDLLFGALAYSGAPIGLPDATTYRYWRADTYLGSFRGDNHAFLVDLGGRNTLVLAMGCSMTTADTQWARDVLAAHRHLPAILVTHIWSSSGTAERTTDAVLGIGQDTTGNCNEGTQVAWTDIVASSPNVRMAFGGHWVDGTGCLAACSEGCATGAVSCGSEGMVSVARRANLLEVVSNWQGWNAESVAPGCYSFVTYSAGTVSVDARSNFGGAECNATGSANWDRRTPSAQSFPAFDPAPCNALMVERVSRVGRVLGCG